MANTKSAKKAIRVAQRRLQHNKPIRSAVRTYVKRALTAIGKVGDEGAGAAVVLAASQLDKAASKGVIHRNTAARRKSRLMKRLNKARSGASA